jgi:hypothetical protein
MKRLMLLGLLFVFGFTTMAHTGDIKIINAKSGFPEGPLWHNNKLYYVEYGAQTVVTWDGNNNQEFWKMEGCGPSAIVALPSGDFLVTCYDSGSIARISAEGKTMAEYKQDREGQRIQLWVRSFILIPKVRFGKLQTICIMLTVWPYQRMAIPYF